MFWTEARLRPTSCTDYRRTTHDLVANMNPSSGNGVLFGYLMARSICDLSRISAMESCEKHDVAGIFLGVMEEANSKQELQELYE